MRTPCRASSIAGTEQYPRVGQGSKSAKGRYSRAQHNCQYEIIVKLKEGVAHRVKRREMLLHDPSFEEGRPKTLQRVRKHLFNGAELQRGS